MTTKFFIEFQHIRCVNKLGSTNGCSPCLSILFLIFLIIKFILWQIQTFNYTLSIIAVFILCFAFRFNKIFIYAKRCKIAMRAMIISKNLLSIVFTHLDIEIITLKGKQCTKPICHKATASRQFKQVLFVYVS